MAVNHPTEHPRARASRRRALRASLISMAMTATLIPTTASMAQAAPAPPIEAGHQAQSNDAPAPTRHDLVQSVVDAGSPGVVAHAIDDGKPWADAAGIADIGTGDPARPDDAVRIGSITKTMTATITLQLVHEGRLRLDDPVERYLPGLLPTGKAITVRNLLQHTSGLPEYTTKLYAEDGAFERYRFHHFDPKELVKVAVTGSPGPGTPGETWTYANTNYVVAQLIVEKVTGTTLDELMQRRIFGPAGMHHTSLPDAPTMPLEHLNGYVPTGTDQPDVDATEYTPTLAPGAGDAVSTAADVDRFFRALFNGKLLPRDLLQQMLPTERWNGYGLGLVRAPLSCAPGGFAYGHRGDYFGYETMTLSTRDGRRQATVGVNTYAAVTLGNKEIPSAMMRVLEDALC